MKNIGSGHDADEFYRYKRDTIQVKYEQKNGGLTHMINLEVICKQIKVDCPDMCKYIQKKLGVAKIHNNTAQGRLIPNEIERIIDRYIDHHVLCAKCKLPEWDQKQKVCHACGHIINDDVQIIEHGVERIKLSDEDKKFDMDVCKELHRLYDERDSRKRRGLKTIRVDKLITKCWKCTPNKWRGLLSEIDIYLT